MATTTRVMLLLPLCAVASVHAQESSAASEGSRATPILLPGSIDGRATPELIPDSVAFRLVFLAMAEPPVRTELQENIQNAKLAALGLSVSDKAALEEALGDFFVEYVDLEERFSKAKTDVEASGRSLATIDFRREQEEVVERARVTMMSNLSPEGRAALESFVRQQKSRMVIAPFPTMPIH